MVKVICRKTTIGVKDTTFFFLLYSSFCYGWLHKSLWDMLQWIQRNKYKVTITML